MDSKEIVYLAWAALDYAAFRLLKEEMNWCGKAARFIRIVDCG